MKFIILFTRLEQNQRILYRKFSSKIMIESISINQKSYTIDYTKPIFIDKKLNRIYVIDVNSGNQLIPTETDREISPKVLDKLISGNFIREFIHSTNEDFRTKLIWFILGCIIGFLAGALIINMIMQEQMNKMLNEQNIETVTMVFNYFRGRFL